jgi:hypothetical protein
MVVGYKRPFHFAGTLSAEVCDIDAHRSSQDQYDYFIQDLRVLVIYSVSSSDLGIVPPLFDNPSGTGAGRRP